MCNIMKNIENKYIYSNNYLDDHEKKQIIELYEYVLKKVKDENKILRIYNERIDGSTY